MDLTAVAGPTTKTLLGCSPRVARWLTLGVVVVTMTLTASGCGDDGGAGATSDISPAATVGSVQTSGAASPATVTLVSPASAAELLGSGKTIAVLDVRTPTEFAAGHLSGAVNLDVNGPTFESGVAALDKSATYFVYCHSGRRSAVATQSMSDKGFTSVYELDGGIEAWLAAGQPVVTG